LLLGLIREGEGIAAGVLESLESILKGTVRGHQGSDAERIGPITASADQATPTIDQLEST
jgi:hypothetical protein